MFLLNAGVGFRRSLNNLLRALALLAVSVDIFILASPNHEQSFTLASKLRKGGGSSSGGGGGRGGGDGGGGG